ncbi:peptidase M14 family protein [Sphingomonas changbaiensis NBRC 104936]|uniref:Peptidase M14 family protein n=1 Tax=Sphingomonas changbaiensis NBRC 104936 TaxID=1219043 RepID=A0A0E9MTA1_9SPHN|nr:M14-type cytosolic carboxypeptidase [Sphingomonas changbaiensis]GAO40656.1 peptidase M14 family protein [Sphingomonas changbaiensis NBRC 104936]
MTFSITSSFDSGNIRVLNIDGHEADLEIVTDHGSDFYQWFYFRVGNAAGHDITLRIVNVAGSAYPLGWPNYRARISEDREAWRLADTSFVDKVLTIRVRPETNALWVAYFAPYSMERHYDLIARMAAQPGVTQRELTRTLDGRPLDLLTLGEGAKQVWLYARQHPGESMAEWWMEGALEKLTDPNDRTAQALRQKATLHIVPNMNPDGSFRGHLRTNAAGVNLNREWHAPTEDRSPEVLAVRDAMDATGVDFAMDVHGDEAIPANFIAGFEGIPSFSEDKGALYTRFRDTLADRSPDFQVAKGYEISAPGKANMSMSTTQLAERYGAVSMTLEMPFKDHDDNPDPEFGWSPDRCKRLAHDCLDNLAGMIDSI